MRSVAEKPSSISLTEARPAAPDRGRREGAGHADPNSFTQPVSSVYRGVFSSSCVPDVYHEALQLAKPLWMVGSVQAGL